MQTDTLASSAPTCAPNPENETVKTANVRYSKPHIASLFDLSFPELLYQAATVHRREFDPTKLQYSILLSVKTGACPEDCKYCSQSGWNKGADLKKERLVSVESVKRQAQQAKDNGATRFCFAAAWRGPSKKDFTEVLEMIKAVKELGMESCVSLGMLTPEQASELKAVGLDYYNHNIDTSPEHYGKITTTRCFSDRLDTLSHVRDAGIHVCSGGIMGMGESRADRVSFIHQLANLPRPPESVPINMLVPIKGTPLGETKPLDPIEFVRTIAVARITMPQSYVRLSAGRHTMSDELQALCFMAGANSVHGGEKLLTTPLQGKDADLALFARLGMQVETTQMPQTEDLPQ